ncbi:MAG: DUF4870 domain-containing protein [Rudaea sp.]
MSVPPNDTAPNDIGTPPPIMAGAPTAEEKQWAMFAHLSAILGAILTGHLFGIGCFLGPLVIWLMKRDTMPFVADQGKQALNFNISLAIVGAGLLLLIVMTFGIGLILAIPVAVVVSIGWLIFTILAAIKASEGVAYRYPISLHLVK